MNISIQRSKKDIKQVKGLLEANLSNIFSDDFVNIRFIKELTENMFKKSSFCLFIDSSNQSNYFLMTDCGYICIRLEDSLISGTGIFRKLIEAYKGNDLALLELIKNYSKIDNFDYCITIER